ncbi:MAG: LOG family protein [Anaerolineae bacterium]|nr:LOG family protein [Anaerolineae bacterium]
MNSPLLPSDLQTLERLHLTMSAMRKTYPTIISLLGSSRQQPLQTQAIIRRYMSHFEPHRHETVFMVGGRGNYGSVMDTLIDECYHRGFQTVVIGVEPVFDLGERVVAENIFPFENITLRCYALTQLADFMIVFPGGLGTIQELIGPLMHKKLDTTVSDIWVGPRAIFVTTDQSNPVTRFVEVMGDDQFISTDDKTALVPVTVANFWNTFEVWLTYRHQITGD